MRTLEVTSVGYIGGGTVRTLGVLRYRKIVGFDDCKLLLINPSYIGILRDVIRLCEPIGYAITLGRVMARAPLPQSLKLVFSNPRYHYGKLWRDYRPDVVISHSDVIDHMKLALRLAEDLNAKSITILQATPFYGDKVRALNIEKATGLYLELVRTLARRESSLNDLVKDLIYTVYMGSFNVKPLVDIVSRKLLRKFDLILAPSPSIPYEMGGEWVNAVISFQGYGLDEDTISQLIEYRRFKAQDGSYAIFPARLAVHKGLADLLLAARLIKRSFPSFKLVMVGSAPPLIKSQLMRLIKGLNLKDNVVLLEHMIRSSEYWALRRNAKLTIYPSHVDSFSYTVLESLILGVPVVAYDIPALRLNYGDINGLYLVRESDIEALAQRALEVLEAGSVEVEIPRIKTFRQVAYEERVLIEKLVGL